MISDSAMEACAQAKAMAEELGKQTRGIKVDMFRKFTSGLKVASSVLPGNPVTREYESGEMVASGGPGNLWKIYSGSKKTTKAEVSIFVFEKKSVDSLSKADRERAIEFFRSGVSRLTRLRHPRLLTVQHPLEESRDSLAFCTEPVFASLANVLEARSNADQQKHPSLKDFELHEVEVKYGLLQLSEALSFLHSDVKMIHGNLTPSNVFVNRDGAWKVAGLECCISNGSPSGEEATYPFPNRDPNEPQIIQPDLDYLAPEYFLTLKCGPNSDMYSIGVIFHALFNNGRPVHESNGSYSNLKSQFERRKSTSALVLNNIPFDVRDHVKLLLNLEPSVRPDASQLVKIPFFEDVGAMALHFLDTLFQKDNLARSKFYRGLPAVLKKLPKRVCLQRVLFCLANELTHKEMVPFILPNILLIGDDASIEEYEKHVQPLLLPLMKIQDPVQILLIFMQNMNLILTKTKPLIIKEHVLPMICRALEAPHSQIQELCLIHIPAFAALLDYTVVKHNILPRIKHLAVESTAVSVRVNCLVCLGKILEHCDKWLVIDEILPMLPIIKTSEPAVLMAMLGIYKSALTNPKLGITRELLGQRILPFLVPILLESSLSLQQFNAFSAVIREMITQIESERRTQLSQLQTSNAAENSTLDFSDQGLKAMMKSKEDNAASPKGATPAASPAKTSNQLTLEEKMRLAAAQENTNVMKKQSPLKVSPVGAASIGSSSSFTSSSFTSSSFTSSSSSCAISAPKNVNHTIAFPPASLPLPRPLNPPPQNSITITPSRTGQVMSQMPVPKALALPPMMQQQMALQQRQQQQMGAFSGPPPPSQPLSSSSAFSTSSSFNSATQNFGQMGLQSNAVKPTASSSSSLDGLLPFGNQQKASLSQMMNGGHNGSVANQIPPGVGPMSAGPSRSANQNGTTWPCSQIPPVSQMGAFQSNGNPPMGPSLGSNMSMGSMMTPMGGPIQPPMSTGMNRPINGSMNRPLAPMGSALRSMAPMTPMAPMAPMAPMNSSIAPLVPAQLNGTSATTNKANVDDELKDFLG